MRGGDPTEGVARLDGHRRDRRVEDRVGQVLFRGLIDTYLHGSTPGPDRASAIYGSALWGLWHLPVAFLALGILTIPYLVIVHTTIGYFLVSSWRRTGNLAAPGIAHAVIDSLRNAVAVL